MIASTVNPFATGVASDAAGISIGDGIGLRIAMWFVLVALAIGYVICYARRVSANPAQVGRRRLADGRGRRARASSPTCPRSPGARRSSCVLFGGTFLVMIYGFIPWNDLWQEGFGKDFPLPTFADFYFPEAAALFLVMAVVIGLIAQARRGGHGDDDRRRRGRLPRRRR